MRNLVQYLEILWKTRAVAIDLGLGLSSVITNALQASDRLRPPSHQNSDISNFHPLNLKAKGMDGECR